MHTSLLRSSHPGPLLAAQGAFGGARFAVEKWQTRQIRTRRRQSLLALTPDEKAYLAPFVLEHQNTQYHTLQDGVAAGLVAKNILYLPSTMGRKLTGFAHNIQPWAKEYLVKNRQLLEGANPEPEGPPRLW